MVFFFLKYKLVILNRKFFEIIKMSFKVININYKFLN